MFVGSRKICCQFLPFGCGLVVKFGDGKCTIHDFSFGDTIVASGSLSHGFYNLNAYVNCVEDVACVV